MVLISPKHKAGCFWGAGSRWTSHETPGNEIAHTMSRSSSKFPVVMGFISKDCLHWLLLRFNISIDRGFPPCNILCWLCHSNLYNPRFVRVFPKLDISACPRQTDQAAGLLKIEVGFMDFAIFYPGDLTKYEPICHGKTLLTPNGNRNPTYNRHYFVDILVVNYWRNP